MTECTFVNCGKAIIAGRRNVLRLEECTFEGNERNWSIPYQHTVAIDCVVDTWESGTYSAERGTFLASKRHVMVKVVDEQGAPVAGATVKAGPGQEAAAPEFDVLLAKTGADGLTPGQGECSALLLSELAVHAPEAEGGAPVRTDYAWTIEAREGDRSGRVERFAPHENWQTVEITIEGR